LITPHPRSPLFPYTTLFRSPVKHLMIGGHVGGTAYILGQAGQRFDPKAQVACVDANYALDACGPTNRGDGLPSAQGNYTYFVLQDRKSTRLNSSHDQISYAV